MLAGFVAGDVEGRHGLSVSDGVDAFYNFEPMYTFHKIADSLYGKVTIAKAGIIKRINKYFHTNFLPDKRDARRIYKEIAAKENDGEKKTYLGIFSDYDDTPRRQLKGTVYVGNDLQYFKDCLLKQLEKSEDTGNEFLYINAWNEWGEAAYLEPDEENGFKYLEAISSVLEKCKRRSRDGAGRQYMFDKGNRK